MIADDDLGWLVELVSRFSAVVAQARAEGADLADIQISMGAALGRATASIADDGLAWRALGLVTDTARKAYRDERKALEAAERVVYRGGDAMRRRRMRR